MIQSTNPSLDSANERLTKKIVRMIALLYFYFFFVATLDILNIDISSIGYIPRRLVSSVETLSNVSKLGNFIAASLGIGMLCAPFLALYFIAGDPLGKRFYLGYKKNPSNPLKTSVFIYLIGAPTLCFLLWFSYSIPKSFLQSESSTFGATIIRAFIENRTINLIIGPFIIVGIALFIYLLFICILGPFFRKN